jgi:hypothetical protein
MGKTSCCCGCESGECCIERIEIDFAVPQVGQPGASFGSLNWNVVDPPELSSYYDSGDLVCQWVYEAPEIVICSVPFGPYFGNAIFPQVNRLFASDYRKSLATIIPFHTEEYLGHERWKTNEIARGFKYALQKKGSLIRSSITGKIVSEFVRHPEPGSVLNHYDRDPYTLTCRLLDTTTMSTTYDTSRCIDTRNFLGVDQSCRFDAQDYSNTSFIIISGAYETTINIDSGWVSGDCSSVPTDLVTASKWQEFNADPSPPGSNQAKCRIPSGVTTPSTTIPLAPPGHPCAPFYGFDYTYSSVVEWLCDHKARIITC